MRASLLPCIAIALGVAVPAGAQDPRPESPHAGQWEGRLGRSALRLVLELDRTVDGLLFGTLISVDQGASRIPIDRITVRGDSLRLEITTLGVTYTARLSADGSRLTGTWVQGGSTRMEFVRSAAPVPAPVSAVRATELDVPLSLAVPVRPIAFAADGKRHLAYEIHVTNHAAAEQLVHRVDVFADTTPLAGWSGADLHLIMAQRRDGVRDNRLIAAGGWAIVYVWVTRDAGDRMPASLRHRLTVGGRTIDGVVTVSPDAPLVIGPPLRGGDWIARNGPDNLGGHHRRALVPLGGKARIAQRFAIDWAKLGPGDRYFQGDETDNRSYAAYGAEALAVADGVITAVRDDIPENVPGAASRAVPMTLETVTGNSVTLQVGPDRFAFYGHLMRGSVRVKPGDRVRRGQVLGLVGNSGNSTGPHLHFHVADTPSPLASEGVPYVIDAWELFRAPDRWERRAREMPLFNARVRFPRD